jgi:hypothetical protein
VPGLHLTMRRLLLSRVLAKNFLGGTKVLEQAKYEALRPQRSWLFVHFNYLGREIRSLINQSSVASELNLV